MKRKKEIHPLPPHLKKCPKCGHPREKLVDGGKWCIVCKLVAQGSTTKRMQ